MARRGLLQPVDYWAKDALACRLATTQIGVDMIAAIEQAIVSAETLPGRTLISDCVDAALDHGLSQGLTESTNVKIRVLTRMAFVFKRPEALMALAMLAFGGYRPDLPHQQTPDDPRQRQ